MRRSLLVLTSLVLAVTVIGGYYAYKVAGGALASGSVVVAFFLLMIPYFALGFDRVVDGLRDIGRSNKVRLTLMGFLLIVPGLIVLMSGGGDLSWRNMAILGLYVALPILILSGWGQSGPRPSLIDLAAVLLLWLPVELQFFERFWDLPVGNPSYVLAKTLGMELALFCFVVVRKLDGVGYRFRLSGEDFVIGLVALGVFLALAVPAALGTGFVQFDPHWAGPGKWLLSCLGIFFFIALPEEVLFRGLIFNILQRMIRTGGPYPALLLSSLIFGLAHLNNPPADWRYVMLATGAGICYGWAYLRTGSLLASAYTHALVDIIGRTLFPHEPR
ncbi:MAG TPA: type II CAAX endopeptidase family protein [Candidatus Polarisedimenticolia bacterium]|nr:type II CAAX endopeptidase family protein [Candidatus Polarisedimenticolia bacterium]